MTPSMYVVCSEHICQGLRGWAGGVGGMHKEDGGKTQGGSHRERATVCATVCVRECVYVCTPAVAEKLNTPCLRWKN